MEQTSLSTLAAPLAVADERSFIKAAKRLAISLSAMSHPIRGPEETPGVRLLSRVTRSFAPTEAGEQLLTRLRPALTDIGMPCRSGIIAVAYSSPRSLDILTVDPAWEAPSA